MEKLINAYVEKSRNSEIEKQRIREKIENYNAKIERLEKKEKKMGYVSWIAEIVKPLAEELAKRTGKRYEIYGPFGMGCRTSIYLMDDIEKGICAQATLQITLAPTNLDKGEIRYETGEKTNAYAPNTIGEVNGFNNVLAVMPDTIEEIEKLLK